MLAMVQGNIFCDSLEGIASGLPEANAIGKQQRSVAAQKKKGNSEALHACALLELHAIVACALFPGRSHLSSSFRQIYAVRSIFDAFLCHRDRNIRERESEMSDFARPQKSRRVQEMARLGRPIGFTSWSNEENRKYH
jgi:hypothetical protein